MNYEKYEIHEISTFDKIDIVNIFIRYMIK